MATNHSSRAIATCNANALRAQGKFILDTFESRPRDIHLFTLAHLCGEIYLAADRPLQERIDAFVRSTLDGDRHE